MGDNVYPCIIYQRLRPSAPQASRHALDHIWPLADQLVEQEGYYPCGQYGDSEFAAPFRGGSEIRPGFEGALARARGIASKLGVCTVLVGNAAPIGDGDPFLPPLVKEDADRGVHVRLINFPLRPHARSTSLRSAWRLINEAQRIESEQAANRRIGLSGAPTETAIAIEVDHAQALARLYLINPFARAVSVQWKLLVRQQCSPGVIEPEPWRALLIPARHGSYLTSVWRGELTLARQLRVKHARGGAKRLGTVHFGPADMSKAVLPLVWERMG